MVFFACLTNNIWMDWILTILEYEDLTKVTTGLLISTIYVLKLSYSLFCTIGRRKNSARTIIDQPSLILLPIFTFFTFSKMNVGCGGKKDVRLKLSKSFSLINFAISTLISLAVAGFYLITVSTHKLYKNQTMDGIPFLLLHDLLSMFWFLFSGLLTFLYLYCDPSFGCCCSCCVGGQQLIHVYDPENPGMEFVYKNGKVVKKDD